MTLAARVMTRALLVGFAGMFLMSGVHGAIYPPFPKEDLKVERQDYWLYPNVEKVLERGFAIAMAVSADTLAVSAPGRFIDVLRYYPGVVEIYSKEAGGWVHSATIHDPYPHPSGNETYFGRALAISGDTLLLGAELASSTGSGVNPPYVAAPRGQGTGAAYVYVKRGTAWVLEAYLKASNPEPGDGFGASVAIAGDYAFVSAPLEMGSGSGFNPPDDNRQEEAGAVYIYSRKDGVWRFETYLKHPHNGLFRYFGRTVAAWGDTFVVAGKGGIGGGGVQPPDGDFGSGFGGTALVYVRDGADWRLQAFLNHSLGPGNVAIHDHTIVVGVEQDGALPPEWPNQRGGQTGSLFVYARQGATWRSQGILKSHVPWSDGSIGFGTSVSVWGDTILAGQQSDPGDGTDFDPAWNLGARGSGSANLYHRSGENWSQPLYLKPYNNYAKSQMDQRRFGFTVALGPEHFFVGALDNNYFAPDFLPYGGAIHVYSYAGGVGGVVEPPQLDPSLETDGGGFTVSWPAATSAGYVLESTESLAPANWQPVTLVPTEIEGRRKVTLPFGAVGEVGRWFRLRRN